MRITVDKAAAVFSTVVAKQRQDVITLWAAEPDREKREQLWLRYQVIDSIEEAIQHEFKNSDQWGTEQPGVPGDG
jgi:hypothetical protein